MFTHVFAYLKMIKVGELCMKNAKSSPLDFHRSFNGCYSFHITWLGRFYSRNIEEGYESLATAPAAVKCYPYDSMHAKVFNGREQCAI